MGFIEQLAQNIRDARIAKEMTQNTLAQQIGVTKSCVSQYETARRMPNLRNMSCISHALDISLDDLVPHVSLYDACDDIDQMTVFDFIGDEHE